MNLLVMKVAHRCSDRTILCRARFDDDAVDDESLALLYEIWRVEWSLTRHARVARVTNDRENTRVSPVQAMTAVQVG